MRLRLPALAAGAVLLSLVAGCGIPDQTQVRVDGPVATPLSGRSGLRGSEPPSRTATVDPGQFVVNYLKQAAGETDGAYDRAKKFLAPESRDQLRARQGNEVTINIVRIADGVPTAVQYGERRSRVTLRVQQVGVLRADGSIAPPLLAAPSEYTFIVGQVPPAVSAPRDRGIVPDGRDPVPSRDDGGLYLFQVPDVLLMSTDALKFYYHAQTIYFWSGGDKPILVPDRRYLADAVPAERVATEVVGWLTDGPPDWLSGAVRPLPDGTKMAGNVPQTEDRLEVPFSAPAGSLEDQGELDRLAVQLAWSLPEFHGDIVLKIRNQTPITGKADNFRQEDKPAETLLEAPQRYCVSAGAVHPLETPGHQPAQELLDSQHNHNVLSAGAVRGQGSVSVALVTGGGNRHRLQVGTGALPVAISRTSTQSFGSMGRPVWLKLTDGTTPIGLVVADRKLLRFDTGARLARVAGVPGLTAVGVSFDGRRIALTATDGGLYVASLTLDGDALTVGPARKLATSLKTARAVDWMGGDSLVVAGDRANGQPAVYTVSVDGTEETDLQFTGGRVSHVVGYPSNQVMFEANGVAWVGISSFEAIQPNQVVGGSGSGHPTAPFYLY